MNKSNIVLIGMMGSGKTTIGKLLAHQFKRPFLDTDAVLEATVGRTILEIFRTEGESGFRQLETETIARIVKRNGLIIATGGGVILNPINVKALQQNGIIIFLSTSPTELVMRLKGDTSRPLLQGDVEKKLTEIYEQRLNLYQEAAMIEVTTEGRTPFEVVEIIEEYLKSINWKAD